MSRGEVFGRTRRRGRRDATSSSEGGGPARPPTPRRKHNANKYRIRRLAAVLVLLAIVLTAAYGIFFAFQTPAETSSAHAPRSEPPPEKPPPSELAYPGFYPASYRIEARYNESPRSITGVQTLRYVNAEARPMDSLHFRLWTNEKTFADLGGGTDISTATVDGKKAEFSVEGLDLEVTLPKTLPRNASVKVVLEFKTDIPRIAAPFGYDSGVASLGVWYPVLAVYDKDGWNLSPATRFGEPYFAEAADYDVQLNIPGDLTPVASGIEKSNREDNDRRTVTYEARSVRDFALAIGEDLTHISNEIDGTKVNVYYRPGSAPRAQRALDLASRSLEYFSGLYGAYPYPEFDLVDAPLVAGTEYSTLTFANLKSTQDYVFDTVVPHEVAHQWWYVQVGSNQFEEPWLDESLTTYSEWLSAGDVASRFPDPVGATIPLSAPVSAFPDNYTYQNVTYLHGAQLYRELARKIGEKQLLRGLREYVDKYRYKTATSEDLISTLSDSAGEDLEPTFKSYGVTPGEDEP